jgi:hypothetical protein
LKADKLSTGFVPEVQRSVFKELRITEARLIQGGVISDFYEEVVATRLDDGSIGQIA